MPDKDSSSSDSGPKKQGSSNFLMQKTGFLPNYAWAGIGLLLALGVSWWMQNHGSNSTSTTNASAEGTLPGTTSSQNPNQEGQGLTPQQVNENYTWNGPVSGSYNTAPSNNPTTSTTTNNTTNNTPPTAAKAPSTTVAQYTAPKSVKASHTGAGSYTLSFPKVTGFSTNPSSYTVAVYNSKGKLVQQQTVSSPDTATSSETYTINGLTAKGKYTVHVWANGGQKAPPSAATTINVTG